jgi:hypothetical protein
MTKPTSLSLSKKDITQSGLSEREFLRLSSGLSYPDVHIPDKLVASIRVIEKMRAKVLADRTNIRGIAPNQEPSASNKVRLATLNRKQHLLDRLQKGLTERLAKMRDTVIAGANEFSL